MLQLILYIFTCIETFLFQLIDETFRYDITLPESKSMYSKAASDIGAFSADFTSYMKYISSTERVLIQEEQFGGYTIEFCILQFLCC